MQLELDGVKHLAQDSSVNQMPAVITALSNAASGYRLQEKFL